MSKLCAIAALLWPVLAAAQAFPDKPIRLVLPLSAGSSTDNLARILAQAMSSEAKQPVIVDNKPGANGFIGVQAVQTAAPDGYTVLITTSSTQVVNRFLYRKLPYDPVKDFAPVTALGRGWLIMVVNPQSPAGNAREFVAMAKHWARTAPKPQPEHRTRRVALDEGPGAVVLPQLHHGGVGHSDPGAVGGERERAVLVR